MPSLASLNPTEDTMTASGVQSSDLLTLWEHHLQDLFNLL